MFGWFFKKYNYSSEPATEDTLEELSSVTKDGSQKTQIVSSNGANLGTSTNPVFVQLETPSIPITIGNVGVLDSGDNRINPAKEDGHLANIDIELAEIAVDTDSLPLIKTGVDLLHSDNITIESKIDAVTAAIQAQKDFEESLWLDSAGGSFQTGNYYFRRIERNETTGLDVVIYLKASDNTVYVPISPVRPASFDSNVRNIVYSYIATGSGTGYTSGDYIKRIDYTDTSTTPATFIGSSWFNETTGMYISAIAIGNLSPRNETTPVTNVNLDSPLSGIKTDTLAISTVEGTITDTAIVTDANGTISGKLRGLVKIFADVWDSASHFLKVNIQNTTLAVTQSGVWTTARSWTLNSATDSVTVVGSITTTPSGTQDVNFTKVGGAAITEGQKTMTNSLPIVLASDQTAIPVNATLAAETTKVIGAVNQGTTPWVTNDPGLPNTLGQAAMAASTSVVIASDQSAIPVSGTVPTGAEKNEDAPAISGDPGYQFLGVRNDARVVRTSNDGDYSAMATDQYGNALVAFPTGILNNGVETAVAGTAVNISAANTANIKVIIQNTGLANARIGIAGVAVTTGFRLVPGGQAIFERNDGAQGDIFAIREGLVSTTILAQPIK